MNANKNTTLILPFAAHQFSYKSGASQCVSATTTTHLMTALRGDTVSLASTRVPRGKVSILETHG